MSSTLRCCIPLGLTLGLTVGVGSSAQAGRIGHSGGASASFRVQSKPIQNFSTNASNFNVQKLNQTTIQNRQPQFLSQSLKGRNQTVSGSPLKVAVQHPLHGAGGALLNKTSPLVLNQALQHQFKNQPLKTPIFRQQFVNAKFAQNCIPHKNCGWTGCGVTPKWCHWMSWCWNPCYYQTYCCRPCAPWVYYNYPAWRPLYVYTCGTYTDLPAVAAGPGLDVELAAVRFVDPGHPEQQLGPRYRVWVRNNRPTPIPQPFDVIVMAANSAQPAQGLPQAGARVEGMKPAELKAVDVRLPISVATMGADEQGGPAPFQCLHLLVDGHQELAEEREDNNGTVVSRMEIIPIEPALFATRKSSRPEGAALDVAGEGLGPQPGSLILTVGGVQMQAEVLNWSDLGVQVRFPNLPFTPGVQATLAVQRTDGATSNVLPVDLTNNQGPTTAATP